MTGREMREIVTETAQEIYEENIKSECCNIDSEITRCIY